MSSNVYKKYWKLISSIIPLLIITLFFSPAVSGQGWDHERNSISGLVQGVEVNYDISKSSVLNEIIAINVRNATLMESLKEIAEEAELELVYNSVDLDAVKHRLTLTVDEMPIHEALWTVLEGTGLRFAVSSHGQLVILKSPDYEGQVVDNLQQTVTGRVTDAQTGEALPGVNVIVAESEETTGSIIGVVTNMEGEYSINVPESLNTLIFSYIGFLNTEINIDNRSEIDVVLNPDVMGLEELVVVGYGVQRRVNLTGSISSVNFDDAVESRPITNATQALGGKATGVWVSQNSGKPGEDGAQLRVRGWGTMNNANPLVIIDGVEGDINQVNPNDIESISVLKDAASAAIYGSKAANGVVLVTTKQGSYSAAPTINISTYTGVQSLGRRFNLINNSAEMMEMLNTASRNVGGGDRFPEYVIDEFRNSNDKYKYPNTDWYKHLYQNSIMQEHNISVSGGSEQTSVYLSLNYLDQDGIILNTDTRRFGIRANVESLINDWVTVGGRMSYISQKSNEPYYPSTAGGGSMARIFNIFETSAPFIAPYTSDGRLGAVQAIDRDGVILYENNNPLIDANNGLTTIDRNSVDVNAYVDIKLANNLNWMTTASTSGRWTITDRYNEDVFGYTDTGVARTSRNLNREGIEVMRGGDQFLDRQVYSTINFIENFNQHEISSVVGLQFQDLAIKDIFARRTDPPKQGLTQVDSGTGGIVSNGNLNRLRIFSYLGRLNYSYANKYLFEVNFRADASSRFSEGNRWGYFPGFSVGWRLIEEEFVNNWNIFSDLKIRGSWGKLGNQNVTGYWPYLPIINQNNTLSYSYGGSFHAGGAITQLVDQNISWETTTSFDVGFEAAFFENKLRITADYFNKLTEDILVSLPIPNTLGEISPPIENIGEMTNKGFELSVAFDNWAVDRNEFGYSVEFNFTALDNEVTKFRGGDSPDQLFLIREGYSFQTLYGYNVEGIYQTDQEASEHMHSNGFTPSAGDLRYEDRNNDGQLGFEDRTELGNTIPKYTFGVNPSISYKGFDLNAVLQGAAKVHLWNQNMLTMVNGDGATTISTKWRDAWSPQNMATDVPAIKVDYSWLNQQSSYWIEEISYIKLKNIQLGYSLPSNLNFMSGLGIQRIYVYANAQNVGTLIFGDYDGYDPERSTFDSGVRHYPVPRILSFGINIEL